MKQHEAAGIYVLCKRMKASNIRLLRNAFCDDDSLLLSSFGQSTKKYMHEKQPPDDQRGKRISRIVQQQPLHSHQWHVKLAASYQEYYYDYGYYDFSTSLFSY